ncbi:MAG: hypothetical protein LBQ42_09565 [Synergistaceae bacterium]|jgi:hypothetical protein|nr:hypothetical protein [Synergistaceae bacterium]
MDEQIEKAGETGKAEGKKKLEDLLDPRAKILLERVLDELEKFDVSAIEGETHLRSLIMERVLKSAEDMFAVSVKGGKDIPIKDLPEDERGKKLDDLMMKVLGDIGGPGPALRRRIATLILHYRMWLRLQKELPGLTPSPSKYEKAAKGIRHIEMTISAGMFGLYAWPLEKDDSQKQEFSAVREKLLKGMMANTGISFGKE